VRGRDGERERGREKERGIETHGDFDRVGKLRALR
jgi:hypothetical protein